MQPIFPSPVKTWHNDTYDAISPTRPELSAAGKTIVITGAGGVVGRETALAFAQANAAHIALIGRTKESLEKTKAALPASVEASVHAVDITDAAAFKKVADEIKTWDVLILGAAYVSKPGYVAAADVEDSWAAFETNVKSTIVAIQAFTPTARPKRAAILNLFSGAVSLPTTMTAGLSSYLVSKLAQAKLLEYAAVENPKLFTASVHPGMIDSPLFRASGATPDKLPMDNPRLPAHFLLWLASEEAASLRGKAVWANWDASELKEVGKNLQEGDPRFTMGAVGWPYSAA